MPVSLGTALPFDSSLENLVRGGKDPLGAPFGNRGTGKPALNVSATEFGTVHAQRFKAKQCNTLGLSLSKAARGALRIVNGLGRVAKFDVRQFVKRGFGGHLRDWVNRNLAALGVSLTVAVQH